MIHPNMATMLGFLFTDAVIDAKTLKIALKEAIDRSFNRITVDGDNSTNDCVAILANGKAKNPAIKPNTPAYREFLKALMKLSKNLASKIVLDGEGATKFVTVRVQGGKTRKQAYLIANSVATSSLVKTALFGEDPNWGRIFCAVGNAGVLFNPDKVDILLNKNLLLKNGNPTNLPQKILEKAMQKYEINIIIGRAFYLCLKNIGMWYPNKMDMDTIGTTRKFVHCVAENEAMSPWPSYAQDQ